MSTTDLPASNPATDPRRNSRDSVAGAGWGAAAENLTALLPPALQHKPSFSWLRWQSLTGGSRNDPLARLLGDPSHEVRNAWLQQMHGSNSPNLTVDRTDLAQPSFVVMGDTGEGDISQYAPLSVLTAAGQNTDFLVICSDVIYPAGGELEYAYKFCWPYRDYPAPIYALPGNHDWYDGLRGFMAYFCGQSSTPAKPQRLLFSKAGLRNQLWLDENAAEDPLKRHYLNTLRQEPRQRSQLPGPYYQITTGPVDLIAIDTGIDGTLDAAQGNWLRRVSRTDKPKILLTGKPIYVNGRYRPCAIDHGRQGTVDDLVRDPANRYIAVIGGDVHNYQRYPVRVGDRTIQYLVSGGGGAYMHPTHKIPNIDRANLPGVTEADFRCYPLRGDSLSFYSQLYEKKFPGSWRLTPAEAVAYLAERLGGVSPTKPELVGVPLTEDARRRGNRMFPLPGQLKGPWHMMFAEFFDWNDPPLFKHLLRVDSTNDGLRITCYPATGTTAAFKPEDQMHCDFSSRDRWS